MAIELPNTATNNEYSSVPMLFVVLRTLRQIKLRESGLAYHEETGLED